MISSLHSGSAHVDLLTALLYLYPDYTVDRTCHPVSAYHDNPDLSSSTS